MARWKGWLLGLVCCCLLAGCDFESGLEYQLTLPSGTRISYLTSKVVGRTEKGTLWEDDSDSFQVIEGTPYRLDSYQGEESAWVLLCNSQGEELFRYQAFEKECSVQYRGEGAADGSLWLCAEDWSSLHTRGYIDDTLEGTVVLRVDPASGAELFRGETRENEFFLTAREDRIYFYRRGVTMRYWGQTFYTQPAQIYYRTTGDWGSAQTVYTFDFIDAPPESDILRFAIGPDTLTVYALAYGTTLPTGEQPEIETMEPVQLPLTL